jgi:hypothetical protein
VTEPLPRYPVQPEQRPVALRHHPRATAALAVGIVSLVGVIIVLPTALGPLAVYLAASARREIDADPGRWGGRSQATAGLTLGIISTSLLLILTLTLGISALGLVLVTHVSSGY